MKNNFKILLFAIICVVGLYLLGQTVDTTKTEKTNTAVKKKMADKYNDVQQKLWEQNRKVDKIIKKDSIK